MSQSLSWTIERRNGATWVGLTGEITEESDFDRLLAQISEPVVVLDLAEIRRINSTGVREWIHFVGDLGKRAQKIVLQRCSVSIVHQLALITNFRGSAEVRSAFAPYFCPSCEQTDSRLVDLSRDPQAQIAESPPCPSCGSLMEFDDLLETFLALHQG